MKIIHISDTHLEEGENLQRWQRLMHLIQSQSALQLEQTILLHTGDLLETGNQANRQLALKSLNEIKPLFKQILLAPGNHDYGGFWGLSSDAHINFINEFHEFIFADNADYFPTLQLIDDQYALIGLDSNQGELCFLEKLFAEGDLGTQQLIRLNQLLDSKALKNRTKVIYLHHHPFAFRFRSRPGMSLLQQLQLALLINPTRRFRRMKNARQFLQTIQNRADVLLFGHKHEGLDCQQYAHPFGIKLAFDAGSSTDTTDISQKISYRVIDLDTLEVTSFEHPVKE